MHLSMIAPARDMLQALPNWKKHRESQYYILLLIKNLSIFRVNNLLTRRYLLQCC